jgi:hypothetical protein
MNGSITTNGIGSPENASPNQAKLVWNGSTFSSRDTSSTSVLSKVEISKVAENFDGHQVVTYYIVQCTEPPAHSQGHAM